jgi:hypothetical protein
MYIPVFFKASLKFLIWSKVVEKDSMSLFGMDGRRRDCKRASERSGVYNEMNTLRTDDGSES